MMATTANQRIDVGALRNDAAVLTAEAPVADDRQRIAATLRYDYDQLGEQGASVRDHAIAIKRSERRANDAVVEAGRHLIAVKSALQHGQWESWLATEFAMTDRTARTLMSIAERFDGKTEIISVLSPTVLGLLAAPSVPDAAVEEVAAAAGNGQMSVAQAKAIITLHKPTPYLSVEQVIDALRKTNLLDGLTGQQLWDVAQGNNRSLFSVCQQAASKTGRVRQHELINALYKIAEERGIKWNGNIINGDRPLPDWAQTDGAISTPTPVPAPPQGDSADLLTTPLDGVSDDDSEGEEVEDEMQVVEFASVTRLADIVSDYVRRHFVMDVDALTFLIPGGYALGVLGQSITARRERYREEDLIAAMGQVATRIAAASTPEDRPVQSDPWLTAAVSPVRRLERAALLADALQPWIHEYNDEYGRDWKHLAEYGNPSHSNSTFWQDIQKECQRRNVRIDDDILKGAIKQAFATMLAQHQAEALVTEPAGDKSGATAPALPPIELPSHAGTAVAMEFSRAGRASSNDLVQKFGYGFGFHPKPPYSDGMVDLSHHDRETKIHRKLGVFATDDEALAAARRDLQERIAAAVPPLDAAPDAARSTWAYWEAQGWRLVRDSKANTLAGVHDATTLATPLVISEAGVIHWLSSGGELTETNYRVATKQPPSPADERNARIKAMIATLTAARDLVAEYEKTTGIYSHSNNLRQAVRPMIEMLERNLTDKVTA